MRLNHDCVRDILLELEEKLSFEEHFFMYQLQELESFSKYGEEVSIYALLKLIKANYINGKPFYADNGLHNLSISSITWEGHQFLDNIRESVVWKAANNKVKGFSSVSIGILAGVAQEYLKKKLLG